jgi:hypothetical protein
MSQQIRKIYVLRLKVVVHFAEVWLILLLMFLCCEKKILLKSTVEDTIILTKMEFGMVIYRAAHELAR